MFEQVKQFFQGSPAAVPPRIVNVAPVHEAASMTRRGWAAPSVTGASLTFSVRTIRDRSRAAFRNDAYARGGIERLVSAICGTGVKPLSQSPDPAFRKKVHAAWLAWSDYAGAGMTPDFYALITQAVREWLTSGEAWLRLRSRLPKDGVPAAPLQIEVLPAESVSETQMQTKSKEGRGVRQGVEVDAIGAVRGYHVRTVDPVTGVASGDIKFVPAAELLHLYREEFPGQLRGIPILSAVLLRLRELDVFTDTVLLRAQLSNMVVGFVNAGEDVMPPDTNDVFADNEVGMQAGTFQRLGPGESVTWSEPPSLEGQSYEVFVRSQLTAVAAALHMSYGELTGDTRDLTDRVIRIQRLDFHRFVGMLVHQCLVPVLAEVFDAWLDAALEAGTLKLPSSDPAHRRVEWIPERFAHFHPEQDAAALENQLRLGTTSRSAILAADGLDPEDVDATIAADNKRADALGLRFDGDGRQPKGGKAPVSGGGAQ